MNENEELSAMVAFAEQLENELAEISEVWKAKTKRLTQLLEVDIPLSMDEAGYTELKTEEFTLKVDDDWSASVPQYKRNDVCTYAEELGLEALISYDIIQKFNKTEQDLFTSSVELLQEKQVPFFVERQLNTGSWKKAIKERAAAGASVDLERACVSRIRKATIKRKKL